MGVLTKVACMVLVCLALGTPSAEAAITPCISYVTSGGAVPANCCGWIRSLYNAAKTMVDHQTVCRCLKSSVNDISYSPYNLALKAGLPAKCGFNIPYNISPSTDCNSVK